ncbi:MAG: DNA-processing protein DprA [Rikenellaceae bacterium]
MDIFDLALAFTPRIGGRTAQHLIETLFSAENIFSTPYDELRQKTKLNDAVAMSIVRREGLRAAEAEMRYCEKHNITPIALVDAEYPSLLRETNDPPYIIYVQGDRSILTHNLVSVVGTRKMTSYGDRATEIIIKQLSEKIHNLVIVSGLAFGIDGSAHRAALSHDVPTVAILPNSLPGVTPAAHSQLATSILDSGGALVTELHSTSHAAGKAYIARNRIIAGISAATIVVESGVKGGAMSTARIASSYDRTVAAIPGRIVDSVAMGCNKLIAERSATILNSADDLIRELKWEDRTIEKKRSGKLDNKAIIEGFSQRQLTILRQFNSSDPLSISELELATGFSATELGVALMELELNGALKALSGARYLSLISDGDLLS